MRRVARRLALVVCFVCVSALGAGCASVEKAPRARTPDPSTPAPPAETAASATPEPLHLRADLSEPAAPWTLVATVPFGAGPRSLGYVASNESAPVEPSSFAVALDGSFWIADPVNARIAHFSRAGTYLGEIPDLAPTVSDLVLLPDGMVALEEPSEGRLALIDLDGGVKRSSVALDGRPLALRSLVPLRRVLVADASGFPDDPGSGPAGPVRLDPVPGSPYVAEQIPGVPVGPETWMEVEPLGDRDIQVRFVRSDLTVTQPIRFEVIHGESGTDIPALVGPGVEIVTAGSAGIYVRVSPARPKERERFGDGRWYLQMGPEGDPLVWERLVDPGVDDEAQLRHLATARDGSIYLMVPMREGVRIYRR